MKPPPPRRRSPPRRNGSKRGAELQWSALLLHLGVRWASMLPAMNRFEKAIVAAKAEGVDVEFLYETLAQDGREKVTRAMTTVRAKLHERQRDTPG